LLCVSFLSSLSPMHAGEVTFWVKRSRLVPPRFCSSLVTFVDDATDKVISSQLAPDGLLDAASPLPNYPKNFLAGRNFS